MLIFNTNEEPLFLRFRGRILNGVTTALRRPFNEGRTTPFSVLLLLKYLFDINLILTFMFVKIVNNSLMYF